MTVSVNVTAIAQGAFWGAVEPCSSGHDVIVEELGCENLTIQRRLDELERQQVYGIELSNAEQDEYTTLEERLLYNRRCIETIEANNWNGTNQF